MIPELRGSGGFGYSACNEQFTDCACEYTFVLMSNIIDRTSKSTYIMVLEVITHAK